ncbi:MAG: hypothetical protein EBU46_00075 [Nitrosomonadaceae bacterium]|nr:hypothetical protein [Nitrosomonadaceae bacterium]
MPKRQLNYIPNHIELNRSTAVDCLVKPTAKVKDTTSIHIKLSGKHADELLTMANTGFARNHNKPPTQLFGFSLTIDDALNGSSVTAMV